jgi:hypothetical protein
MPLGRPAIPTPARLDLTRVQQVIENIRERFRVTDEAILALQGGAAVAARLALTLERSLQNQIDELLRRIRALEAAGQSQFSVVFQAGEDIETGAPLYVSADGIVSRSDPDDLANTGYLGIATDNAAEGDSIIVRLPGGVVEVPTASFTVGRPLYGQLGGMTHSPAGNSLPVGIALSSTVMAVGYGFNVLGDEDFDPTGQDDMAVTRGLAGSGGGVLPVVTGEVPPVLVYLPDGNLVYVEID